jgi:hypothetical protein
LPVIADPQAPEMDSGFNTANPVIIDNSGIVKASRLKFNLELSEFLLKGLNHISSGQNIGEDCFE